MTKVRYNIIPDYTNIEYFLSPAIDSPIDQRNKNKKRIRNKANTDVTNAAYFPTRAVDRIEKDRKKKNEPAFKGIHHSDRVQSAFDM